MAYEGLQILQKMCPTTKTLYLYSFRISFSMKLRSMHIDISAIAKQPTSIPKITIIPQNFRVLPVEHGVSEKLLVTYGRHVPPVHTQINTLSCHCYENSHAT